MLRKMVLGVVAVGLLVLAAPSSAEARCYRGGHHGYHRAYRSVHHYGGPSYYRSYHHHHRYHGHHGYYGHGYHGGRSGVSLSIGF